MTRNSITETLTPEQKVELAREYFRANPTPLQELCPEVNQYFSSSKGFVTWSSKTGLRTLHPGTTVRDMWHIKNGVPVRNWYYALYLRYIEELDALEISSLYMYGKRGVEGVAKKWSYDREGRNLIFRNDTNRYCDWQCQRNSYSKGGRYYCESLISFMRNIDKPLVCQASFGELKKFAHTDTIKWQYGNNECPDDWQYIDWYQKSFMPRNVSKKTKTILEYGFADPMLTQDDFVIDNTDWGRHAAMVFEETDDQQYGVIRLFTSSSYRYDWQRRCYFWSDKFKYDEYLRIFINEKGKPTVTSNCYGSGWKIVSTVGDRGRTNIIINDFDVLSKWKPLKYIISIMQNGMTVNTLLAILRHPIVEQLTKAGYPNIARLIASEGTVCANLKNYFGVDKETKTPMYKLLGVNKYTLKSFEKLYSADDSRYNGSASTVRNIKALYGRFDISDLDEQTVTTLFDGISSVRYFKVADYALAGGFSYTRNYNVDVTDADRKALFKVFKMNIGERNALQVWKDTLMTYRRIENKPEGSVYNFHSYQDLVRLHDALMRLQLAEQNERAARYNEQKRRELEAYKAKFEKLQKDRIAKYEYENDQDDFVIRVPHELFEITREGQILGHCVGGYVNSHASGSTNIIFLRRKSDPTIPFYTIEIKDDAVIQIHGRYNRWLGNNPEAVPFMYKYLKQLGVHFNTNLLLNKGAGYSASNDRLPESALYADAKVNDIA